MIGVTRYAVRDAAGVVVNTFRFDLTPLYARRGEWTAITAEQKRQKEHLQRTFDEVTICRRAAEEALNALAQHHPDIDREQIESSLAALKARTPKRAGPLLPDGLVEAWKEVRKLAEDAFYQAGCGGTDCRQIEAEKGSPSETCDKGIRAHAQSADPIRLPSHPVAVPAFAAQVWLDQP
ncbi:helix-turn-helix domain-containing protein [Microvirga sp. P5_D2]